ncbi:MAG TPA: O-antigen ligase family protein [Rhizomicrobium sp.]|nr:O-antigen ligase family protein [Rhizomicrobium sp.]
MVKVDVPEPSRLSFQDFGRLARVVCFWLLIAIIAWAPFPLGSNREWSWGLLTILVAVCWLLWSFWAAAAPKVQWENFKRAWIPLLFVALTLIWAVIQTLPVVPAGWTHPLWASTASIIGHPIAGAISLNRWRTANEVGKLATYVAIAWLAFTLSRDEGRASRLLTALIIIGAFYAVYAFAIALTDTQQFRLFYAMPATLDLLSGPFVQRNNFATYEGMAALAAAARLVEVGGERIQVSKGFRRLTLTTLQFAFGSGAPLLIATILTVSALVATGSRGGFIATLIGLAIMAIFTAARSRGEKRKLLIGMAAMGVLLIGALVWISGGLLSERLLDLTVPNAEPLRRVEWGASTRMIASAPWLGLGPGAFQDAYPMYAIQVIPYILDKAHNDWLESAAGLGLPAAVSWWLAMSWLVGKFLRAFFTRRKNRLYSLVGIGATSLVAMHSLVDFSLQMPAVASTYAVLIGLALAQSFSSRTATSDDPS